MRSESNPVYRLLALIFVVSVFAVAGCGPKETDTDGGCTDEQDNDSDGAADCADKDCKAVAECIPESSHADGAGCNNGVDDDNDGLVDCPDPDCTPAAECEDHRLVVSRDKEQQKLDDKMGARTAVLQSLWAGYQPWLKNTGNRIIDTASGLLKEKLEKPKLYEGARKVGAGQPHGAVDPVMVKYLQSPEVVDQCKQLVALDRELERMVATVKGIEGKLAALRNPPPPAEAEPAAEKGAASTP